MNMQSKPQMARGFSMIEVLVTIVILAFGLLGLAGLQTRVQTTESESFRNSPVNTVLDEVRDQSLISSSRS